MVRNDARRASGISLPHERPGQSKGNGDGGGYDKIAHRRVLPGNTWMSAKLALSGLNDDTVFAFHTTRYG
jgi:hypothetical protein